ncbi:dicarboxylate/amino acid:cation symporter [Sphingomonas sabuli]|uniref:Dicarboxylate/amino acid:cation symporter n=1 Tax=Sphingomonas sabuli TaxID=2764186 RepID=A0A7G9L4Y7_9SPHN|nr:dicarboxylate/amino acid:cation symporter [Sphingomonas sabuli]QNM83686.1 dicarboxylate/amino acid:cation symporter [Sphingomonas sabuli]
MLARVKTTPLALKILAGLALGAVVGLALPTAGTTAWGDGVAQVASIIGNVWLSALQVTILPLVFALIATTFSRSRGIGAGGLVAQRTVIAVAALYGLAILSGAALATVLYGIAPVPAGVAQALRAMGGEVDATPLPVADMILGMVPKNIVAAMAGPSLLPVLIFALLFGAALVRIDKKAHRDALINGLNGLADAMFVIIGWVLAIAPIGIFFLVIATAHQHGTDLLVGLAHYIGLVVVALIAFGLILYLVAILVARLPAGRLFRAMLPTQAVAFGTQSSLASLPLILKSCQALGLRETTSAISAPLAVTLMRVTSPVTHVMVTTYAAAVYGVPFAIPAMLLAGLVGALLEVGSVGIPSTATFVALRAPVLALFGIPLEIIAIFLVVETIPDMFKTVFNVTADVTAVALVDRSLPDDS